MFTHTHTRQNLYGNHPPDFDDVCFGEPQKIGFIWERLVLTPAPACLVLGGSASPLRLGFSGFSPRKGEHWSASGGDWGVDEYSLRPQSDHGQFPFSASCHSEAAKEKHSPGIAPKCLYQRWNTASTDRLRVPVATVSISEWPVKGPHVSALRILTQCRLDFLRYSWGLSP